MGLLQPNQDVPFNITRLSHVCLTSRDLEKTRYFYQSGLGLEVTSQDETHLYLRATEETGHHSIVFEKVQSDQPGMCRAVTYRMYQDDDIKRAHDWFNLKGYSADFVDRDHQGLTLRLTDAVGVPIEFCATMDQSENQMRHFHTHRGARLSFLDHIQIATHDVQAAYQFYNDLGFRLTEYTATDGSDEMWGVWLKRKNNTQDVVYSNGAGPRLHHIAFHTPEIANVIHGADVMASLGLADAMDRAPGRHGIGNAFFVYYRDPDGHRVETFTSHYNVIDCDHQPTRWDLSDTRRSQIWGFPAPKKWFFEATAFDGVPVSPPKLDAPPVTLEDYLAQE